MYDLGGIFCILTISRLRVQRRDTSPALSCKFPASNASVLLHSHPQSSSLNCETFLLQLVVTSTKHATKSHFFHRHHGCQMLLRNGSSTHSCEASASSNVSTQKSRS